MRPVWSVVARFMSAGKIFILVCIIWCITSFVFTIAASFRWYSFALVSFGIWYEMIIIWDVQARKSNFENG